MKHPTLFSLTIYLDPKVIEKDRMYVDNASRASKQGLITPENLEPSPKNPIISAFFRNICNGREKACLRFCKR